MYLVRVRTQSIRLKLGVKLRQKSMFRLKTTVSVSSSFFSFLSFKKKKKEKKLDLFGCQGDAILC